MHARKLYSSIIVQNILVEQIQRKIFDIDSR